MTSELKGGAEHRRRDPDRIRIRAAQSGDLSACAAIVTAEPLWHRYGTTARRARQQLRGALDRRDRLNVAVIGGEIVGFIWFQVRGTFAHSGYIRWVGIAASSRGKGVGSSLMDLAERQILRHGPNVFLLVSDFNRLAQRFYRRRGYRLVGALADYVVPGVTELVYRKTLGPIRRPPPAGSRA